MEEKRCCGNCKYTYNLQYFNEYIFSHGMKACALTGKKIHADGDCPSWKEKEISSSQCQKISKRNHDIFVLPAERCSLVKIQVRCKDKDSLGIFMPASGIISLHFCPFCGESLIETMYGIKILPAYDLREPT